MRRLGYYFIVAVLLATPLAFADAGKAGQQGKGSENCDVELVRVPESTLDELKIDDDFSATLETALEASMRFLDRKPGSAVAFQKKISPLLLRQSLQALLYLVKKNLSKQEFLQRLRREFDFFTLTSAAAQDPMLITGYFEPEYPASLVREEPYLFPLYAVPGDLVESESAPGGKKRIFRRQDNMLFPYWRREEIDTGKPLAGSELAYLSDPFDAFVLHVQGSGRLRLTDGTLRRIRYAGNNGHPYKSIGHLLVENGAMPLEQVSMPAIKKYLRTHPGELRKVLYYNDRYIFFAWDDRRQSEGEGPIGSMGEPLVPGRSVALDQRCYPLGLVGFLNTRQPRFDEEGRLFSWVSLHRLVVNQDSGAAINGPHRLDLFYGHGPYAERAAGIMRQRGDFYILLKKQQ